MNPIEKYFSAEKAESLVFLLLGIIAALIATYFLVKVKQPFFSGMSYPLLIIAIIQITVGLTIFYRSPADLARVENYIKSEPQNIQNIEIPRMQKVMQSFKIYFYVELFLLAVGLFMHFYYTKNWFLSGIGFGLMVQCIAMLIADYFANNRGKIYIQYLENLS